MVFLLHGFDSRPAALVEVAERVASSTGAAVFCPQGPVTLDNGNSAWWATDYDPTVLDRLHAMIDNPENTVVAGFSQGAALALAGAFADGAQLKGVASVGGFLPDDVEVCATSMPLLFVHGVDDEVVDPFYSSTVARRARTLGCTVTHHEIEGGHSWSEEATTHLLAWLQTLVP